MTVFILFFPRYKHENYKLYFNTQGCQKFSIIVHYFSTFSYLVYFRHFCSFKQKRKTLKYKSCELFGKFSKILNFQNVQKFKILKNFKYSKFSKILNFQKFKIFKKKNQNFRKKKLNLKKNQNYQKIKNFKKKKQKI